MSNILDYRFCDGDGNPVKMPSVKPKTWYVLFWDTGKYGHGGSFLIQGETLMLWNELLPHYPWPQGEVWDDDLGQDVLVNKMQYINGGSFADMDEFLASITIRNDTVLVQKLRGLEPIMSQQPYGPGLLDKWSTWETSYHAGSDWNNRWEVTYAYPADNRGGYVSPSNGTFYAEEPGVEEAEAAIPGWVSEWECIWYVRRTLTEEKLYFNDFTLVTWNLIPTGEGADACNVGHHTELHHGVYNSEAEALRITPCGVKEGYDVGCVRSIAVNGIQVYQKA